MKNTVLLGLALLVVNNACYGVSVNPYEILDDGGDSSDSDSGKGKLNEVGKDEKPKVEKNKKEEKEEEGTDSDDWQIAGSKKKKTATQYGSATTTDADGQTTAAALTETVLKREQNSRFPTGRGIVVSRYQPSSIHTNSDRTSILGRSNLDNEDYLLPRPDETYVSRPSYYGTRGGSRINPNSRRPSSMYYHPHQSQRNHTAVYTPAPVVFSSAVPRETSSYRRNQYSSYSSSSETSNAQRPRNTYSTLHVTVSGSETPKDTYSTPPSTARNIPYPRTPVASRRLTLRDNSSHAQSDSSGNVSATSSQFLYIPGSSSSLSSTSSSGTSSHQRLSPNAAVFQPSSSLRSPHGTNQGQGISTTQNAGEGVFSFTSSITPPPGLMVTPIQQGIGSITINNPLATPGVGRSMPVFIPSSHRNETTIPHVSDLLRPPSPINSNSTAALPSQRSLIDVAVANAPREQPRSLIHGTLMNEGRTSPVYSDLPSNIFSPSTPSSPIVEREVDRALRFGSRASQIRLSMPSSPSSLSSGSRGEDVTSGYASPQMLAQYPSVDTLAGSVDASSQHRSSREILNSLPREGFLSSLVPQSSPTYSPILTPCVPYHNTLVNSSESSAAAFVPPSPLPSILTEATNNPHSPTFNVDSDSSSDSEAMPNNHSTFGGFGSNPYRRGIVDNPMVRLHTDPINAMSDMAQLRGMLQEVSVAISRQAAEIAQLREMMQEMMQMIQQQRADTSKQEEKEKKKESE